MKYHFYARDSYLVRKTTDQVLTELRGQKKEKGESSKNGKEKGKTDMG